MWSTRSSIASFSWEDDMYFAATINVLILSLFAVKWVRVVVKNPHGLGQVNRNGQMDKSSYESSFMSLSRILQPSLANQTLSNSRSCSYCDFFPKIGIVLLHCFLIAHGILWFIYVYLTTSGSGKSNLHAIRIHPPMEPNFQRRIKSQSH